jgi:anti-sigma-K factor RskA
MSDEELRDLLAFAALDTLESGEAPELTAHLASCPTGTAELAALREVVGWMGVTVTPLTPPATLRARILRDARLGRRPVRLRRALSRTLGGVCGLVGAATVVALTMYSLGLASRVRAMESQLAAERETARFLASPDTATIVLAGTEQAPKARVKLAYDRRSGRALLFGYDVPPAPQGKSYQLWFIAGGKPLPGRVFEPDATGRGQWSEEVPAEGRGASVFAVTLEPAGGATAPTGPMILKSVSLS